MGRVCTFKTMKGAGVPALGCCVHQRQALLVSLESSVLVLSHISVTRSLRLSFLGGSFTLTVLFHLKVSLLASCISTIVEASAQRQEGCPEAMGYSLLEKYTEVYPVAPRAGSALLSHPPPPFLMHIEGKMGK